jgi:hypothetical protein
MEHQNAHRAADMLNVLIKAHVTDEPSEVDVHEAIAVRDDIREFAYELEPEPSHTFDLHDYAVDDKGPTPSLEKNTVEIVELTNTRADEFEVEDGKTVAEYDNNRFYPEDDLVVGAVYSHLSNDKRWHFPESRLREI